MKTTRAQTVGKRGHALLTLAMAMASGTAFADSTTTSEKDYALPKCNKPVASVMVGKLTCKSAACQTNANQDPRAGGLIYIMITLTAPDRLRHASPPTPVNVKVVLA